jgi:hypothetical protein
MKQKPNEEKLINAQQSVIDAARMQPINSQIADAIARGDDTTGLCTVRQLVAEMLNAPRIGGECVCELAFTDELGRMINIECAVTFVDGVPHARQWVPNPLAEIAKIRNREADFAINQTLWQKMKRMLRL